MKCVLGMWPKHELLGGFIAQISTGLHVHKKKTCFGFFYSYLFSVFLEREEGIERNIIQERSIDWLPSVYPNQIHNLSVTGRCSNQLSHTSQGKNVFYVLNIYETLPT